MLLGGQQPTNAEAEEDEGWLADEDFNLTVG